MTVADVAADVDIALRWGWSRSGPVECDGAGPVMAGTALTCTGSAAEHPVDVLVVVLDDNGRYTFTMSGPGLNAVPQDYPPGTADCEVLAAPPAIAPAALSRAPGAGAGRANGLDYISLLHHWLSLGRPAGMDADGDGRPCEDTYPDDVIDRTMASPLTPGSPVRTGSTMEEVRRHAQAVLSGTLYPLQLAGCGSDLPARTGASMRCRTDADYDTQQFDFLLLVLDDTGRYSLTALTGAPLVSDYPAGSTCQDFGTPPSPDWEPPVGADYADVVGSWFAQGRPESWDPDGDGRPCEEVYGAPDRAAVFDSALQP